MSEHHILNLGAGVQSTALYLLSREPDARFRFDLCVFADTGEEPAAVYKHLNYFAEFLRTSQAKHYFLRCAKKTTILASISMT